MLIPGEFFNSITRVACDILQETTVRIKPENLKVPYLFYMSSAFNVKTS